MIFRHTDHLRGLDEAIFAQYVLNNLSTRIYCSDTTRYFLSTLPAYKHLAKFYSVLNVNQPFTIQNPADESKKNREDFLHLSSLQIYR